jgi:hypothetical protein
LDGKPRRRETTYKTTVAISMKLDLHEIFDETANETLYAMAGGHVQHDTYKTVLIHCSHAGAEEIDGRLEAGHTLRHQTVPGNPRIIGTREGAYS